MAVCGPDIYIKKKIVNKSKLSLRTSSSDILCPANTPESRCSFCSFIGLAHISLQDEVHRKLLHMLPAVPWSGPGYHAVCVVVEQPVPRWFRLGWLSPAVQLAPSSYGNRSGCAIWLR